VLNQTLTISTKWQRVCTKTVALQNAIYMYFEFIFIHGG